MKSFLENLTSYAKVAMQGVKEIKNLSLSTLRKVFSLMGRREKIVAGALLLAAGVSLFVSAGNFYYGHTVAAADVGGSYTEGLLGQPGYINPLLARTEADLSLANLVFSGLYKYDPNGQLEPDLAEGMPQISGDQKQYTINLKHNAKWQNGKQLTADDVVFTIQMLQDPNFKSPLRPLWQSTSVEKLSDYSVRFTTKDVSGPFIQNLTLPILPKNVWSNVDAQNFLLYKANLEAIGSGPYAIKEIKKLPSGKVEQISLEANNDYYFGRPKIEQIIFKFYDNEDDILNAFHSREIEGFGFTPLSSSLYVDKNQSQAQVINVPLPQYQMVFFNLNNPILANQSVRQALSLATDKQAIIAQVFKGNGLIPTSPLVFFSTQNQTIHTTVDLTEAGSLLDKAGWPVNIKTNLRSNSKGQALSLNLSTNDALTNAQAAQALAEQWRQLKITVNLNVVPSAQLMDSQIKPRAFDVLLFPQKFGADPDPFLFWHSSQVKDPGFNLTGFASSQADKLIIEARTTTDRATRAADYQKFNDLVMSQYPVIFLDQTEYVYVLDNKLKNVNLKALYDPSQRFYDAANWYAAEKRIWK